MYRLPRVGIRFLQGLLLKQTMPLCAGLQVQSGHAIDSIGLRQSRCMPGRSIDRRVALRPAVSKE